MSTPLVAARGLGVTFGGGGLFRRARPVVAVTDLDLDIWPGQNVGLVGESGSGKSTIGRMLLGMLRPTAGSVLVDGQDLATAARGTLRGLRRHMQPVFQDPLSSLDPRRPVGRQIADGIVIHDLARGPDIAARVAELLELVGLDPRHASRYPHEFSGGQRQRICIARALATKPNFIVADEPVSALDVSIQAQIMALFYDLRAKLGLTMLFISHDLPVVRTLCDHVVVLYLGRVMEKGPAEKVFGRPTHPYTRALLQAAPRMDFTARPAAQPLLKGEPPSPANPPSGCVFRTRCPVAVEQCAKAVPAFREYAAGHEVACIRDDLQSATDPIPSAAQKNAAPSKSAPA